MAGNFDGNAGNGDEIGLFDGRYWWLDTDRDFVVSDNLPLDNSLRGYPIVGDFDGDGRTDLATYLNGVFSFDLGFNGFGTLDASFSFSPYLSFIGSRERPVAADFNQDGVTDLGLWTPDRSGQTPDRGGEWYVLVSTPTAAYPNRASLAAAANPLDRLAWVNHEFRPVPLGRDVFAQFGDDFAAPIFGNFDPPVALSTAPPGSAVIEGTTQADKFEFRASSTSGVWTIRVNGVEQYLGPDVAQVVLDGLAGRDSLLVVGSEAEERFELQPGAGTYVRAGYTLSWGSIEDIVVNGRGNNDVAIAAGFGRRRHVYGHALPMPCYRASGYSLKVNNLRQVIAVSSGHSKDQARLYDNPAGKDTLVAGPTYGELFAATYYVRAEGFRWVMGCARGGEDSAELFDRPHGKDYFVAMPDYARLSGSSFFASAKGFDKVVAHSSGGSDGAYLYDNPATTDSVVATVGQTTLTTPSAVQVAIRFPRVSVYSRGGQDRAELTDNPATKDRLDATPQSVVLYGPGFYNRLMGFADVSITSSGGGDVARIFGAATGAEAFTAGPSAGILVGTNYRIAASGFRWLTAYSQGGLDVAQLYDSAGNDIFIGRPDYSELYNAQFSVRAVGFRQVRAFSAAGGVDQATLVDKRPGSVSGSAGGLRQMCAAVQCHVGLRHRANRLCSRSRLEPATRMTSKPSRVPSIGSWPKDGARNSRSESGLTEADRLRENWQAA